MTESGIDKRLKTFLFLMTFHTALLVASNAGGAKMISVFGHFAASATVFSYMFTFVILGVISELFGREYSKTTINVGLFALVASVLFFKISIAAPPASFWTGQQGYEATLGSSPRFFLGGWTSYMIAQYFDVWSFFKIKKLMPGDHTLWLRAIGSMLVGQLADTIIFITIGFYGAFPLLPAIIGQYLLKIILAIISLPLIYYLVKSLRVVKAKGKESFVNE